MNNPFLTDVCKQEFLYIGDKKASDAPSTCVSICMFASLCVLTPREENELAEDTFLTNTYPMNWAFLTRGGSVIKQRRQWQPTPVLLPGKSHGQRSLVGCSPWGR